MKKFKYVDLGESLQYSKGGSNTSWSSCGCGISIECQTHNCGTNSDCKTKYCRQPNPVEKPEKAMFEELASMLG